VGIDQSMTGSELLPSDNIFPSFSQEDQELARELSEQPNVQIMGPPAFASPDPATAGGRLVPIEEHPNRDEIPEHYGQSVRERMATHHAPGAQSLDETVGGTTSEPEDEEDEDRPQNAGYWKSKVAEAETQEELDNLYAEYQESGSDFKTVEEAFERKQTHLARESEDDDE
jgi:hypothetical protein